MAKRIEVDARIRANDTLGDVNDAVQTSVHDAVWWRGLVAWWPGGACGSQCAVRCGINWPRGPSAVCWAESAQAPLHCPLSCLACCACVNPATFGVAGQNEIACMSKGTDPYCFELC